LREVTRRISLACSTNDEDHSTLIREIGDGGKVGICGEEAGPPMAAE